MNSSSSPGLEIVYGLDVISNHLGDRELSRTKIYNAVELEDSSFYSALAYGCEIGCLQKSAGNVYKVCKSFKIPEDSFYPIVANGLEALWLKEKYDRSEFYIEQTARRDSKIAGPWTRPDLTLVSHKKFPWTIGSEFDVVTFEVKRPDSCNVLAVFEALSHASAATRAYVVFPIDWKAWKKNDPEQEKRVMDECSKHGVGLVLIEDVYRKAAPLHLLKARKREIDHDKCSNFLGAVLNSEGKDRISAWK